MPQSFEIDVDAGLVILAGTGALDIRETRRTIEAAWADPRYRAGFHFLADRRGTAPPTTAYVHAFTAFLRARAADFAGAQWATVVSETASYGMGRMGEMLSDGGPVTFGVFTSIDDARRWLAQRRDQRPGSAA
jgi:hypothetical protein